MRKDDLFSSLEDDAVRHSSYDIFFKNYASGMREERRRKKTRDWQIELASLCMP